MTLRLHTGIAGPFLRFVRFFDQPAGNLGALEQAKRMNPQTVISAINESPMNRGLRGADWVADDRNIAITDDAGNVTIFDYEDEGVYQAHFLRHEGGRGAIRRIKAAYSEMFERHGATVLFGLAPDDRPDVKLMARWTGAKSHGRRLTEHGFCELFILTRHAWSARQ